MARQLRIEYAGAIYHVTVRGNARQCIFLDERDRWLLCERLARAVETYSVRLYLFCLMENHFHLVLETPKANLGRFMHSVLTSYTVCYNLRHDRHGHLTQGRYGAKLVEGNDYLLKLSRYVHLNPVKVESQKDNSLADRITALRDYEWSSYRSYIGLAQRLEWVDYEPMLALVGGRGRGQLARYRRFVETGISQNDAEFIEDMQRSARCVGSEDFSGWVDQTYNAMINTRRHPEDVALRKQAVARPSPEQVLSGVAAIANVKIDDLKSRKRQWLWKGVAARLLVAHAGMTRRDCAGMLGINVGSGVTYQIKKAELAMRTDSELARRIAELELKLYEK